MISNVTKTKRLKTGLSYVKVCFGNFVCFSVTFIVQNAPYFIKLNFLKEAKYDKLN